MKVIKQNLKRLKANKGFSLVESVIAVLMVTLITGMLLLVVNLAKNTYEELEKNAEGQVLSAILINRIQDELRFAKGVSGTTDPVFFSANYEMARCQIVSADRTDDNVKNKRLYILTGDGASAVYNPLIGNSSYVFDLGADVDITYNDGEFDVTLYINDSHKEIIKTEFTVKQLNN